ncbi:hypothetical protein K490DRAFT_50224 [Saccharata proteae CBS 121410]|uniref:Cytoplasmic tRNA 2-thiolation protein 2 n=1 Tax=Saccharata proteae CBS 121410 TaxID=1314787 RepID=A0A9P4HQX4_9PEZI|nr:hypothetical protein K490DRAFT_50224 [Saccharata proteae CBS 121410]
MDPTGAGRTCRRCQTHEACVVVRSDPLCRDCFLKYVNTKVIKRMESYRYQVRYTSEDSVRMLLVPVSFGVSSVTLVQILDQHLKSQMEKTGRLGYGMHILHVDMSAVDGGSPSGSRLDDLKQMYPEHTYTNVALADIFNGQSGVDDLLKHIPDEASAAAADASQAPQTRLENLIKSLPSATSRSDVVNILRTKLIVQFAQQNSCEGILWGDSTTKIAEKTLSETAKGRGFSLPWQVADGPTPFGVNFHYPLRDLLKKELTAHADIASPPLTHLIAAQPPTQVSASAKNTTIDDLMKQYFESVEQEYPSIVANVVRTSSKLEAGETTDARCRLCNLPVPDGLFGIHGWGGDQEETVSGSEFGQSQRLCYGCTRSAPRAAPLLP